MRALIWLALLTACAAPQVVPSAQPGQPLVLQVQDLITAQPLDVAPLQGHVVLVDLWASWCESCKAAMPHHVALWQRLHARGFDVVALSVDEDRDAALQFLAERPLPFLVAWDAGQKTAQALRPEEMPTAYVVDRQGKIVAIATGGTTAALRVIVEAVEAALEAP